MEILITGPRTGLIIKRTINSRISCLSIRSLVYQSFLQGRVRGIVTNSKGDLSGVDPTQLKLLSEKCILVSAKDEVLGAETKKNCHLNVNIDSGLLHRAFSVLLFDTKGRLLLQQRAKSKIFFPEYYTNTCCSHPLYRPEELEENEELGVKRAAQRKLAHELGIPEEEVPPDCFTFLTRILYKARSCDTWGEHEIDYILFAQRDVKLSVNHNEVQETRYVTPEQLRKLLENGERGVIKWWNNLSSLDSMVDKETIHNMY